MYLKFDDGVLDYDLDFVRDLFALLDERLDRLQERIDECSDPDQLGLFDEAEFIAGVGFVACQRYLASTYGPHGLPKDVALKLGPHHHNGESYACILNAAANYWKHVDEWDASATIARDIGQLDDRQQRTIHVIESVTPWSEYTCAHLLCELTPRSHFSALIPTLEAWRERVDAAQVR